MIPALRCDMYLGPRELPHQLQHKDIMVLELFSQRNRCDDCRLCDVVLALAVVSVTISTRLMDDVVILTHQKIEPEDQFTTTAFHVDPDQRNGVVWIGASAFKVVNVPSSD